MPRYNAIIPILESPPRIPEVVDGSFCGRHSANGGSPCWWIYPLSGGSRMPAVCNSRAKNAGFVGEISPTSMGEGRIFGAPRSTEN